MSVGYSSQNSKLKLDFFGSITYWFNSRRSENSLLIVKKVISVIARKLYLSQDQHQSLQIHALYLQKLLAKENNHALNEDQLITVLQGNLIAGERLIGDVERVDSYQRGELLHLLSNFSSWFMTLNEEQKERVILLQEKPFRLSMG